MPSYDIPSVEQLREYPELAPLAILDHALQASIAALCSTHDLAEPGDDNPNYFRPTTTIGMAADTIVLLAESLRHALATYLHAASRQLILNLTASPGDIAF